MTKYRIVILCALLVVLIGAASWMLGAGSSAGKSSVEPILHTSAATKPSDPNPDALLPPEFAILQTRNAFGRGNGGPESMFVFKGAVQSGSQFTAFVEDLAAKKVLQILVGGNVAQGSVKSIDLDAIEYASAGNSRRIEVGQNLAGETVQEAAPPAPAGSPPGPNAGPPGTPVPMAGSGPQPIRRRGPPPQQ
jgi:hypothetical protein